MRSPACRETRHRSPNASLSMSSKNMARPTSPRRRRTSRIPIAPSTSINWLCQAPIRFTIRCAAYSALGRADLGRARIARSARAARVPADPASQSHQQRRIHGHQVGPADDRLGHVFGQGDAAGDNERHLVPYPFLHQPPVHFPQSVLDMPARPPALEPLAPVQIGAQMEHLDARAGQFRECGRPPPGRAACAPRESPAG